MKAPSAERRLSLLSVVIPARDEEDCIGSTAEHLHVELRLHDIPTRGRGGGRRERGPDVIRYWQTLGEGYDCVFGSRFQRGGGVIDYPWIKWLLNRAANFFIQTPFA